MSSKTAHEFALSIHTDTTTRHACLQVHAPTPLLLRDTSLVHRLIQVLRVKQGDIIVLFDQEYHGRFRIEHCRDKREVEVTRLSLDKNQALTPTVHWALPLLEPQAWEEALMGLTVLGATTIQPLMTQKAFRTSFTARLLERQQRLMVAAAEQSKQFILPAMRSPMTVEQWLVNLGSPTIFFDVAGKEAHELITFIRSQNPLELTCMVGPAGDLTTQEKQRLLDHKVDFYRLTVPILRSQQAAFMGMGLIRCLSL
jgi:RsmE family RNA methyltransferase